MATILLSTSNLHAQQLKASGKKIIDDSGNEVILRGMGLGGWMLQEPYMMEMSGFASAQWDMKAKIKALIGEAYTESFYNAWLANHCTKRDIDSLAAWGFNSVRLPMHYNLFTLPIEDEPVAGENTWLEKGFVLTDSLISWCKANNMYVILDLHAAPGGQGKDAAISDYNPSKPSLWESESNKQKTIALWKKLAQRYVNEPWVAAYDLINEPNWSFTSGGNQNGCSENSNAPLRQLYVNLTNAIRAIDTKHIIIIEGNCWGNNYNGIFPLWDNNMVLSFHKYWSVNDAGSISGIMGLRNQYNVPIWLGESGENSNAWFTDAIELVEKNGIGWAWWPMKKIGSVVNPFTIVKTDNYQTLLNYWDNGGTAPDPGFAYYTLMQMAENTKLQNCIYRKDVPDAMFRQVHDTTTVPYKKHTVPGTIPAAEFDMGRHGKAYKDTQIATYHVTSGSYTAWNTGWTFRNDGVDIEESTDSYAGSNGHNIGWTEDGEWLKYTVDVDSTCAYKLIFRYAIVGSASKISIQLNDADMTGTLSLPSTGGWQSWNNLVVNDVILYKGRQSIKVVFEKGGANFSLLNLTLSKKTDQIQLVPKSAETHQSTELIYLSCNKMLIDSTIKSDGFSCTVNGENTSITSLIPNPDNAQQVIITLGREIFDIDVIKISYSGNSVKAVDGTVLQPFTDLLVKNNLPIYTLIPGKIEAEAFSVNQGLQLETTTDAGGGQNVGFTNTGDYLDYKVRVLKDSKYFIEVRVASAGTAGKIEIQQLNSYGAATSSVILNVPVTGGWQTWKTIGSSMDMLAGTCTLRVKILQPEFNMNWYRFSETGLSVEEVKSEEIQIYPNPAKDFITVIIPKGENKKKTLSLYSVSAGKVRSITFSENELTKKMFVQDLPRGMYIAEYEINGIQQRSKIILQ